jgi:hypothetical protein
MVEVDVHTYAQRHGISVRRVQAAAGAGSLPARKLAGRWVIDTDTARDHAPGRPLSARQSRALLAHLSADATWRDGLSASECQRVVLRAARLRGDSSPAHLLAEWIRSARPLPHGYRVADADLEDLRADARLTRGGISDSRSGLSDAGALEAHVAAVDLDGVVQEFLLVPDARPNVLLHIDDELPGRPLPLGDLIADLAQHEGPRERDAAAALIEAGW